MLRQLLMITKKKRSRLDHDHVDALLGIVAVVQVAAPEASHQDLELLVALQLGAHVLELGRHTADALRLHCNV